MTLYPESTLTRKASMACLFLFCSMGIFHDGADAGIGFTSTNK